MWRKFLISQWHVCIRLFLPDDNGEMNIINELIWATIYDWELELPNCLRLVLESRSAFVGWNVTGIVNFPMMWLQLLRAEEKISHLEQCQCLQSCSDNGTIRTEGEVWERDKCSVCRCRVGSQFLIGSLLVCYLRALFWLVLCFFATRKHFADWWLVYYIYHWALLLWLAPSVVNFAVVVTLFLFLWCYFDRNGQQ